MGSTSQNLNGCISTLSRRAQLYNKTAFLKTLPKPSTWPKCKLFCHHVCTTCQLRDVSKRRTYCNLVECFYYQCTITYHFVREFVDVLLVPEVESWSLFGVLPAYLVIPYEHDMVVGVAMLGNLQYNTTSHQMALTNPSTWIRPAHSGW